MPRWLQIRPKAAPWEEVRPQVAEAVGRLGAAIAVGDDPPSLAWHDGPAVATVREAVGELAGWAWTRERSFGPSGEAPPTKAPTLEVRRTFSERALAVALVRFYGARGRYFTTADAAGADAFDALLDVDDPARSGYPIVDAVTDLLLAADAVAAAPGTDRIDALSARLRAAGYENLWAVAYRRVG